MFFSSRISPRASTVIFCDRSPLATAVVTAPMLRTWLVRLPASMLTFSVRSFQVPATPGHPGLAAELALDADLAGHRDHLIGEDAEGVGHVVDRVGQRRDLALGGDRELLRQVAVGHRGHDLDDAAHLAGQVGGHQVDVVGEVLPGAGDALDLGLAAELAFGADLLGDAGHLGGEGAQLIHHRVDGALELEDLAPGLDGDLLREVAVGHRRRDEGDVADLGREITGQQVDVVGEVLPGAGDALDLGLPAELALGADLAGHAGHLGGDQPQPIDQLVDGGADPEGVALDRATLVLERHLVREVSLGDVGDDPGRPPWSARPPRRPSR